MSVRGTVPRPGPRVDGGGRVEHRTSPARPPDPGHERRTKGPAPPPPPSWRNWLIFLGIALTILLLLRPSMNGTTPETLTYSQFLDDVRGDKVQTATIDANGGVVGQLTDGTGYRSQIPVALQDNTVAPLLDQHHVQVTGQGPASATVLSVILSLLPLLLFVGLFIFLGRRAGRQLAGGLGALTGSRAKLYDAEKPTTRFSDVAGYEGAKQEVAEVVDFLKHPNRYSKVGAIGPKGVLMVGPPGTGKTLMARAVAGEAGVPFFSVTGSSFIEIFVGVGASRVRDLFVEARKRAPAIVFIDEIDAIGARRGGAIVSNDEREQTLNQLLAEMDGFDPSAGVVVMAATNRPETLDPALLRPGRFDRQVEIPLPNLKERAAILAVHAKGKKLGPDVDLRVVARGTPGFSGADLANLLNEAAIVAVRAHRDTVTADDFDEARDRILLGRRDASNALLSEEKQAVAVHEAGHALVAVLSEHADPVSKVTILPAGQALGVTQQLPVDERHLYPESYLQDSLAIRMGGRAAEQLVVGEVSTGASNDLAGATQLATRMVVEFGMSPELGPVGFSGDGPAYLGQQEIRSRQYAEATQRVIDQEVERLLKEANERAMTLLSDHRVALDKVAALLLERETIDGSDVMAAAGMQPESLPAPRVLGEALAHRADGRA
ncbi:MAG: ATP-dependent zinc metalloprotease FtsH [Actinobacteria bacterium]|nr:MAG: ATP-dependent zinc metalloprotease FtsH [Actinomycetota bacterium]